MRHSISIRLIRIPLRESCCGTLTDDPAREQAVKKGQAVAIQVRLEHMRSTNPGSLPGMPVGVTTIAGRVQQQYSNQAHGIRHVAAERVALRRSSTGNTIGRAKRPPPQLVRFLMRLLHFRYLPNVICRTKSGSNARRCTSFAKAVNLPERRSLWVGDHSKVRDRARGCFSLIQSAV